MVRQTEIKTNLPYSVKSDMIFFTQKSSIFRIKCILLLQWCLTCIFKIIQLS